MRRRIIFMAILSFVLLTAIISTAAADTYYCPIHKTAMSSEITNSLGPYYVDETYHATEWDVNYYCTVNGCSQSREVHDSESTPHSRQAFDDPVIAYQTHTSLHHKKITTITKYCGCNPNRTTIYETTTTNENHVAQAPTSESCTGTLHRFYANCDKCNATYLYSSAACDGVNHPSHHVNRHKPNNEVN